ncbi:hypothetical protein FQR65_LT10258 [Abscondita terminalis]|nr:hypothetical protein FQR65_LT10258 [Abscondita terminalis]
MWYENQMLDSDIGRDSDDDDKILQSIAMTTQPDTDFEHDAKNRHFKIDDSTTTDQTLVVPKQTLKPHQAENLPWTKS